MSSIVGSLWTVLSSYRPNAARDGQSQREKAPARFGAFETTYTPPGLGVRRPRNDAEAQRLYNHIRTVAFWLDAAPLLSDLGLPFKAGLDDIISLVPFYGDIVSGILQLYQVWLCFVFGVPGNVLGLMLLNVLIDIVVGIIPVIGDLLDNLFKSNLRNLTLLESYLLTHPSAKRYHILLMPEGNDYLPRPPSAHGWSSGWFGGGKKVGEWAEDEGREGRVRVTRRMGKEEGRVFGSAAGGTRTGAARGTRSQTVGDPVSEQVD